MRRPRRGGACTVVWLLYTLAPKRNNNCIEYIRLEDEANETSSLTREGEGAAGSAGHERGCAHSVRD